MLDRDALSARLSALEGYLAELRPFSARSREEFVRDSALHHLGERLLHLACECVLDIAHHIIAEQGYRQATGYRDAIAVLHEEGLLDEDLRERLERWMGFRNVLVHFYLTTDHGRCHDAIREDLVDFEEFARRVARLLAD